MYSNLQIQLKEGNALHKFKEVMEEVPRVRKEMGYPLSSRQPARS